MSQPVIIDFAKLGGPVFTGRTRGEELRKILSVEELDDTDTAVEVKIPDSTYAVSSSFILGLFGKSVVRAGTKQDFYKKYKFTSNLMFKDIIDSCVTRALQEKRILA